MAKPLDQLLREARAAARTFELQAQTHQRLLKEKDEALQIAQRALQTSHDARINVQLHNQLKALQLENGKLREDNDKLRRELDLAKQAPSRDGTSKASEPPIMTDPSGVQPLLVTSGSAKLTQTQDSSNTQSLDKSKVYTLTSGFRVKVVQEEKGRVLIQRLSDGKTTWVPIAEFERGIRP